jgi:hypothetical protein
VGMGYKELHGVTDGKISAGGTACCLALLAHALPSGFGFMNALRVGLVVVYGLLSAALHVYTSLVEKSEVRFVKPGVNFDPGFVVAISSKLQKYTEELELTIGFDTENSIRAAHNRTILKLKVCELVYDDLAVADNRLSRILKAVLPSR